MIHPLFNFSQTIARSSLVRDKIVRTPPRLRFGARNPINSGRCPSIFSRKDQTLSAKNFSLCATIRRHSSWLEHWRRTRTSRKISSIDFEARKTTAWHLHRHCGSIELHHRRQHETPSARLGNLAGKPHRRLLISSPLVMSWMKHCSTISTITVEPLPWVSATTIAVRAAAARSASDRVSSIIKSTVTIRRRTYLFTIWNRGPRWVDGRPLFNESSVDSYTSAVDPVPWANSMTFSLGK
jgi:hypothetical protein